MNRFKPVNQCDLPAAFYIKYYLKLLVSDFPEMDSVSGGRYPNPVQPGLTRVGWIGTGIMGSAMASRLLSAGYSLTVFSRTPSKTLTLLSAGATAASSAEAVAASSDVVFTMLSTPSSVRSVILSSLLPSSLPNLVLVDSTTSSPSLAAEISSAAVARSVFSVDAPVSGGDYGARDGTLAVFAGGDPSVVSWLSPLFDVLGRATYMGPAGTGQSAKIANQIAIGGSILGLSESLAFAEGVGLNLGLFLEAVRGGAAGSKAMEIFGERIVRRELGPGGFAEYMVKDLGMALDGKVALPGAALCYQLYLAMVANGDSKMGTHALISVIERINGRNKQRQHKEEEEKESVE
ncbi:uncharacterized protein M6B38_202330 [Iris pallida]|uniref:Uncharacterized protein n=1 Tax=Iris pallida TaxID=29817 RepID=A0AAX6EA45_IRIPA|nr:uncharacterized protein M6B38_202330 [Iris pallida]